MIILNLGNMEWGFVGRILWLRMKKFGKYGCKLENSV